MSNNTILVVEDDADIRNQVVEALELEDYEVHQAGNGQEALDYLLQIPEDQIPACMILDLMMPVMDGNTLMNTIHNFYNERLGKISIIVVTAKRNPITPDYLPFAVERIQKPFNLDELYQIVKKYCN